MATEVPTVLVTGASGYIATHIVQQLQQTGEYKVRGTVRSTKNEERVAPLKNLCPGAKYPLELVEGDLTDEKPWLDAVKGCTYVLHTASPFPFKNPKHEDELIRPAVDGTLNVLKACRAVGGVKRVVLTSSGAAIEKNPDEGTRILTEEDWTDVNGPTVSAYYKSKTLAEKAAWDFVKELPEGEKFELAVVNPVMVMGPPLCGGMTTSLEIPKMLLERTMPMVPNLSFNIIDVRDVARAHINAMTLPEAAGHRHILSERNAWFIDMAKILSEEFADQGYKVPTSIAPNVLIWFTSLFDESARLMKPMLGKKSEIQSDRMTKVLGITPIKMKQSVIEMAYSMIEAGKIKKTSQYRGPPTGK